MSKNNQLIHYTKPQKSQVPRTIPKPKKSVLSPRTENKTMEDNIIKDTKNLSKLKKNNNALKDRIIRDIRSFFECEDQEPFNNWATQLWLGGGRSFLYVALRKNKIG